MARKPTALKRSRRHLEFLIPFLHVQPILMSKRDFLVEHRLLVRELIDACAPRDLAACHHRFGLLSLLEPACSQSGERGREVVNLLSFPRQVRI